MGRQRGHQGKCHCENVIKSTVQPKVSAVLGATVDQVASQLIDMRDKHAAAPPFNPPMAVTVHLYISRRQNGSSIHLATGQLYIISEIGTMGIEPTQQITNEVDLFVTS